MKVVVALISFFSKGENELSEKLPLQLLIFKINNYNHNATHIC